jgi:hypothetical protein
MKYPEMKHLSLSVLFAGIPAQAATTLFDDFSDGLSTDKYREMVEHLEFSAVKQGYLKHSRANHLWLIYDDTSLFQVDPILSEASVDNSVTPTLASAQADTRTTSASGSDSSSGGGAIHPFVLIFAGFLLPAIAGFRRSYRK